MEINISGWFGFWILCAVFVVAEMLLVFRGFDTFLWKFKTAPELKLQQILIDRQKNSGNAL